MPNKKYNKLNILISVIFSGLIIASASLIVINRQYILDQIAVWQFTPTSEISGLIDRAGMNDYGKFLYYASSPSIETTQDFNRVCGSTEATTSILGCLNNGKIYIYNVTDAQLDGIREVTAAHETLHAAFSRINDDEKAKLHSLLNSEYKKLENDTNYSNRMSYYARYEPGQRDNELFSVVGTEVSNIDNELEEFYDRFFSDRQAVVSLNAKYIGVFQTLKNQADALNTRLSTLSSSISTRTSEYNLMVDSLNADILDFNNRASSRWFTSQSQFDTERQSLNNRVENLDSIRTSINSDSSLYSSLLSQYNSIATESKKLYDSLDSTLAPAPTI